MVPGRADSVVTGGGAGERGAQAGEGVGGGVGS